jgi:predicted DNA-binding transcriptional regulator YafY/REP element-mobilizing transposase RayT
MPKKSEKNLEAPPTLAAASGLEAARSSRPPVIRMVRIHELLTSGKYPNCSSLAREFEVSSKTIQRDIDFMRDQLALPIEYDGPRHGYFYARAVAQFPMITVSEGELVALLVAQKAVEQYRGTSFEKPLHAAFEKLVASLGNEASVSLHELSEAVSFRSAGVPKSQIEVFELLAEAVMAGRVVEFEYLSLRARTSERRRVEPYHLACISNQWYLIANDLARKSLRTFALTRIEKARDLGTAFERPADFSAAKMLADSFSAFEAGKPETVRIRFDDFAARLVAERQWHKSQKLRRVAGGGAELTMEVGIAPDLESWILGWGGHAEVLEPAALREKIAREVQAMTATYAGGRRSLGAEEVARDRNPPREAVAEAEAKGTGGRRSLGAGEEVARDRNPPEEAMGEAETKGTGGRRSLGAMPPGGAHSARRHPAHHPPLERHNESIIVLVTVCTHHRKSLLANQNAFDLLRSAWERADSWHVGRFVLMPDHLHLFCSPAERPGSPLKRWVRVWKADVSRRWPSVDEQPIWQNDFWGRQLRRDEHYAERWNYVLENPVRARLCPTAEDWPWKGELHELRW